jgi:hypothetical protein
MPTTSRCTTSSLDPNQTRALRRGASLRGVSFNCWTAENLTVAICRQRVDLLRFSASEIPPGSDRLH